MASGIAAPYAGRLLAMFGATVVKVEPDTGDPIRGMPIDDEPLSGSSVSPLYAHLNAGKLNVAADDVDIDWADLVLSDQTLAQLEGTPLHPSVLGAGQPRLVTITPWGADRPVYPFAADPDGAERRSRYGPVTEELLVQAATGFPAFNRDPDGAPLRLPGWQSQYAAGGLAASAALAALRSDITHVDISWYAAMLTTVEIVYFDALHTGRRRQPVGAHPPSAFPSGAIPCLDGFVNPGSIRPVDWEMQCLHYGTPEWIDDPDYAHRHRRPDRIPEIWERIAPWYAERTKREIFQHALETPWAIGMVLTPTDALADEHIQARNLWGPVAIETSTPDQAAAAEIPAETMVVPLSPVRGRGLPVPDQKVAARHRDRAPRDTEPSARSTDAMKGFAGSRIIEMTLSWAGPYVGNILGPLGADVIKIESQRPFDGFRAQRPYDHGMKPGLEHLLDDPSFFDASGYFNSTNKSKRSCVIDLSTEGGHRAFLELVANCDGLVANFSADVLPKLGLDFATLSAVNPRFVVVRAPAFGVHGPYSGAVGYGSIVEAMGGLGHRAGYEHEGARISNVYYPDPVSGIHIAASLMAGLHQAARTGEGMEIDLSHQDVTWLHSGEAIGLAASTGRDIGRMGNREPGVPIAGFFAASDGWVAAVATAEVVDAVQPVLDRLAESPVEDAVNGLRAAGAHAMMVLDPWTAPDHPPFAEHLEIVEHPVTGTSRHVASPFTLDGQRRPASRPAPCFDQHTDEVLSTVAGLSEQEIAALRAEEAVGGQLPHPSVIGIR